jgi:bifunctional UDP-N-acetylglucosamine pyrophosphorylase/glucosamine-1-phosphate N-acetyltransferase
MTRTRHSDLHVVILAAGKGTRMKTRRPKLLHPLAGMPLVQYALRTARALAPRTITLVVGYQADELKASLAGEPDLQFALQQPQLGTGHAVLQAEQVLRGQRGTLLLLSGDVPMTRPASLERLVAHHEATGAAVTLITAHLPQPRGYGRIIRIDGRIARIVEERDASPDERAITEINSGIWAFAVERVFDALRGLSTDNDQGEYYLTDLVDVFRRAGAGVETVLLDDPTEIRGINSQADLADLAALVRRARTDALMAAGVTFVDPTHAYIGADVEIGADSIVHPNVVIDGRTRIGQGCVLHPGVRITNSQIADGVVVLDHSVVVDSRVAAGGRLGPFAHLRPGSDVGEEAHVGNFVELKKTVLGARSKASHLTYLGDATIGEGVNVGAGTITCNYDGVHKHPTVIEDGAFIGSDSQLVAPVTIGKGAYVGAGSSITKDVPAGALAVARGQQVVKEGWVARNRRRREEC